jgi:hypothetical protein
MTLSPASSSLRMMVVHQLRERCLRYLPARRTHGYSQVGHFPCLDVVDPSMDEHVPQCWGQCVWVRGDAGQGVGVGPGEGACFAGGEGGVVLEEEGGQVGGTWLVRGKRTLVITVDRATRMTFALTFSSTSARKAARGPEVVRFRQA